MKTTKAILLCAAVAKTFRDAYPEADCAAVSPQDFFPFLLGTPPRRARR